MTVEPTRLLRSPKGLASGLLFLALFALAPIAYAQKPAAVPPASVSDFGPKGFIPEIVTVLATKADINQTVCKISVSHPYETAHPELVETGVDAVDYAAREVSEFFGRPKPTGHERELVMEIYGLGAPKLQRVFDQVLPSVDRATIITDLNQSYTGKFAEGERFNSRFSEATLNATPDGQLTPIARTTQYLVDEQGFKVGGRGSRRLLSPPLYNRAAMDRVPLFHPKIVILREVSEGKVMRQRIVVTTGNLVARGNPVKPTDPTPVTRYNRTLDLCDDQVADHLARHAQWVANGFAARNELRRIETPPPVLRIVHDNGVREVAFTDSRLEVNRRITNLLALASENLFKLDHVVLSQFVVTYGAAIRALSTAMEKQADFRVQMVVDARESDIVGWGLSPAIVAGIDVIREYGGLFFGWGRAKRARVDARFFALGVPGVPDLDPRGVPVGRHLQHDKTTLIKLTIDPKNFERVFGIKDHPLARGRTEPLKLTVVFWGSMNFSNAYEQNGEVQFMDIYEQDSPIALAIEESIQKGIFDHPAAIVAKHAFMRRLLAHLLGRSDVGMGIGEESELTDEDADAIIEAIEKQDLDSLVGVLTAIGDRPTSVGPERRVSSQRRANRIDSLRDVLALYTQLARADSRLDQGMSWERFLRLVVGISEPDAPRGGIARALESAVWSPRLDADDEAKKKYVRALWKASGRLLKDFPEAPPRGDRGEPLTPRARSIRPAATPAPRRQSFDASPPTPVQSIYAQLDRAIRRKLCRQTLRTAAANGLSADELDEIAQP